MSYTDPNETHPQGMQYASFQHRLGALALDVALCIVTLNIGWIIWSLIVWGEGQTPGKKILKIRVRNAETGAVATWGHMAVREFLVIFAVAIAVGLTSGLALIAWIVIEIVFYFTKNNRTLRDLWVKTAVINEA
jgi:uncharacterized RDD family membrane protein YckC